ncbi:hypothetical protein BLA60_20720 [Actinophytocola xinjiangensis]|uniref:DUF4274 domain-containing protein n=1 Tax=Actinophytocola xinjiangensis TaxID=485602 RepID=A0A7Z1AXZ7_9PSEU|nr:DUF4274 domain-containing protein [Actinophytocola xinjiangensis]OLF09016.1 hypothetical protein BLA60_20720 [Actinophytocola xinjiangensis]
MNAGVRDEAVGRIVDHEGIGHDECARLVGELVTVEQLRAVVAEYNWDCGYEVPAAVVAHPACDRGLALLLFWEFDDGHVFVDGTSEGRSGVDDPMGRRYARTLVDGLREGRFPSGSTVYDTGCFGEHLHPAGSGKARLRELRTRRKLTEFPEAFLRPELG